MYIQIEPNADGSHDYQIGGALENGYAVVPSDMKIPDSFPYVDIIVETVTIPSIDGGADITRAEVVSMTTREIPEEPAVPESDTIWDELDAAYQEGVDSV